jgi:hypothetical protein
MSARSHHPSVLIGVGLVAVVAAGCATATHSTPPATHTASTSSATSTAQFAARYLAIATPANHVLDVSFDALSDHDDDLAASASLLQTIASTERSFDRDLLALQLPGQLGQIADAMVRVNEARATLTTQAATASSVASLRTYETELDAMNAPVETQVRALRVDLRLPPPDTD